jgi:hypothetical protein
MHQDSGKHPARLLLSGQQPSLSGWYGDPLGEIEATALHASAQAALQQCLCGNREAFPLHVLQLACDFWCRADVATHYGSLAAAAVSRRDQALLELVYGQLLMARKMRSATGYLDRGFALAVPWLASAGYFELVRRHELLSCLCLSDRPAPAQGLTELLSEVAVVRRMRDRLRRKSTNEHRDTVG